MNPPASDPHCSELEELIRHVNGDTDPEAGARLDEHLNGCESCRAKIAALEEDESLFRELTSAVRASAREDDLDVPYGRGSRIDSYQIVEEIHRGGQGTVYKAVDRNAERTVALKILNRGFHATPRDRYRFEREVELASTLRHPNIVPVYESGLSEGRPYYSMHYIDGRHLDDYITQARPPRRERIELFLGITQAVAYAHRTGVIHRDLKPSNIIVDPTGSPHILDFGLAKALDGDLQRKVTRTGQFMGTLAYASPEQVAADGEIGTPTDVYSLGVILYELLLDERPYEVGRDISTAIKNITEREPKDPYTVSAAIGEELRTIVLKCLAKDPQRRYASAGALASDLECHLAGRPIEAKRDSLGYILSKKIGRHRWAVATGVAFLLVAGLAAYAVLEQQWRARSHRQEAALIQTVIQDILSAAEPERMGGDVTVVEVLDQAAQEIETRLRDAPDAHAAVRYTIGETYRRLMMLPEAEPHLRAALERYRAVDDGRGLEVARCLHRLGEVLSHVGVDEAVRLQEEALTLRERALPPGHRDIAESQRDLAFALYAQRRPDLNRAESLLNRALEGFENIYGLRHPDRAMTLFHLGNVSSMRGQAEQAGERYREALDVFDRLGGEHAPRSLEIVLRYASYLRELERFDEAEGFLDRAVELTTEHFGGEKVPDILRRHAQLRFSRKDYEAAERFSRQALVKELEKWQRRHPEDVELRALIRRLLAGEPAFTAAFVRLRSYRGIGDYRLASWMNGLGRLMETRGHPEIAESLYREALVIRCRLFGRDCPIRMSSLELLGDVLLSQDRLAEARPLFEDLVATRKRDGSLDSDSGLRAREKLASCCRALEARTP